MLHGVLGLRLLIAKMLDVCVCEWSRCTAYAKAVTVMDDDQALACGGGEESHR